MQKLESGSAHVVVIVALIVVIVCALGVLFWQNFIQDKSQDSAIKSTSSTERNSTESEASDDDSNAKMTPASDPNNGYTVLEDWGIRFKANQLAVSWSKTSVDSYNKTSSNTYYFTTNTWKNLAGACNTEIPLIRSTDKIVSMTSPPKALNNEMQISNYYYYYYSPQDACGTDATDINEWSRQSRLVMSFLDTIEAKK